MAFTGLSQDQVFAGTGGSGIAEDVSPIIAGLSNFETPLLDWLGDAPYQATQILHEFMEEDLRPNYLTTASAINSATAATGIQLTGLGNTLTVGTILELEASVSGLAFSEFMQVTSVVGANSVLVSRNFGTTGIGSLATSKQLFVRGAYALEGGAATGDVTRGRTRRQTYVGMFQVPISVSLTLDAVTALGRSHDFGVATPASEYDKQKVRRTIEVMRDLEKEVIRGLVSGNTIATPTTYRTFNGLLSACRSINSTVLNASFDANPHKYLGDIWQQAFTNGASPTEEWAILADAQWYRSISNLNDTKVQDSNASTTFQRVIRTYTGPFGNAEVLMSRWMPGQTAILIPRNRVKVVALQGRTFQHIPYGVTKSSRDGAIEGEYTVEIHHPEAIPQVHNN